MCLTPLDPVAEVMLRSSTRPRASYRAVKRRVPRAFGKDVESKRKKNRKSGMIIAFDCRGRRNRVFEQLRVYPRLSSVPITADLGAERKLCLFSHQTQTRLPQTNSYCSSHLGQ